MTGLSLNLRGNFLFFAGSRVFSALILKRPNKQASSTAQQAGRTVISYLFFIAAGMGLMLLLQFLFWPGHGALSPRALPATARAGEPAAATKTSPWGQIEYMPIALDRPEAHFNQDLGHGERPVWIFRNHTEQQLTALLAALDLNGVARAQLGNRAHWEMLPDGIRLSPAPEVVLGLSTATRQRLYGLLGANPENVPQAMPFRFRRGGFDEWFADCGLPATKRDLARSLTYTQENSLCFADAATFSQVSTPEETKCLIKSLWRVPTFVMQLHLDAKTDRDALLKYWGALGPAHTYKPLLESMARVPDGSSLNIADLLPPFARLRLYTYPAPRDPKLRHQDCFWTAMNFFNPVPDDGFFNPEQTQRALREDYLRVRDGSKQFGDVLLLVGRDHQALHMCVHIADEVVFTKNGANPQQPWVLMKLPEMLDEYAPSRPYEIQVYRRKTPPPLSAVPQLSAVAGAL